MPRGPRKSEALTSSLRDIISHEISSGTPLPSIRSLAKRFSTTPVTVLRAVARLGEDGLVAKDPMSGRFYRPEELPDHSTRGPSAFRRRHEQIADELRAEILSGVYLSGTVVPSVKELQLRYVCARETAGRALKDIVEQGLAVRRGRAFVAAGGRRTPHALPSGDDGRKAGICLAGGGSLAKTSYGQYQPLVEGVERQVAALGWGGVRRFLADDPESSGPPPDHEIAGFVFIHAAIPSGMPWRDFFARRTHIRCVALDPTEAANRIKVHRSYYRIAADGTRAGRDVARCLLGLGHRSIAFISHLPFSEHAWAARRLNGVRQEVGDMGSVRVAECSGERIPEPEGIGWLVQAVSSVHRALGQIDLLPAPLKDETNGSMYQCLDTCRQAVSLQPVLEDLLDTGATAWVGCNDLVAMVALQFLQRRGIRVGRDISVIGFDNRIFTHPLGLSSYEFPYHEMGNLAVRCLEDPRRLGFDRMNLLRVAGRVIVRESVGPPVSS